MSSNDYKQIYLKVINYAANSLITVMFEKIVFQTVKKKDIACHRNNILQGVFGKINSGLNISVFIAADVDVR